MTYRTSNKQIGMVAACPRKWAAHYLFGFPEFPTDALRYGVALHAQAAAVLSGAAPPYPPESDQAKLFRAMVDHLPEGVRNHREQIETVEDVQVRAGLVVQLRADYTSRPWFVDWKTTGAPSPGATLPSPTSPTGKKFWALQSLGNEYQPRIYARLLFRKWGVAELAARWVFGSKKFGAGQEPKTWHVDHFFEFVDTRDWWDAFCEPAVALMQQLRQAKDDGLLDSPQDVPHDGLACENTGLFCDYAGHCRLVPAPQTAPTLIQLRIPHPERKNRAL